MPDDDDTPEESIRFQVYRKYRTQQISLNPDASPEKDSDVPLRKRDSFDVEKVKYHLSWRHRESALLFASEAKKIEESLEEGDIEKLEPIGEVPIGNRHDSFVINSIISSVAYLESVVNEFYKEKLELAQNGFSNQRIANNSDWASEDFYRLLEQSADVQRKTFEYKSTLEKYQTLLIYADGETFDPGKQLYQKVKNVCEIRNHFVHHEPEWVQPAGEEDSPHRLISSIRGKFDKNPLVSDDALEFPDQYLSASCAEWCFNSISEFIDAFFDRLGASPPSYHEENLGLL